VSHEVPNVQPSHPDEETEGGNARGSLPTVEDEGTSRNRGQPSQTHAQQNTVQGELTMTLDELKKAEREAHSHMMGYECVSRGYDFEGAAAARQEWLRAKEAVERAEKAVELIESAPDDSILGMVRKIKQLSEQTMK
jgi:hypothetical protein